MNLWLRFLYVFLTAFARRPLAMPHDVSVIGLRVWLNDLDLNLHMNNGRYLTIMDLGRTDLMIRAGVMRTVLARRWRPVLTGATIRYRRPLAPFQRFRLETWIAGRTTHSLQLEQRFVIASGAHAGEVAASATVHATILAPGRPIRKVPVEEIFGAIGLEAPPFDFAHPAGRP